MNGGIEAAGDAATGAAWSRTVEPQAGAGPAVAHGPCLNCGAALIGRYCHACGQSGHLHKTLVSIVHDLLHGVFHFEGKIWRTVPMLVLHPGKLTRRYIDGERAKFVSPLALFLFTVFLMFAVYSAVGPGDFTSGIADGWNSVPSTQLEAARTRASADLAHAVAERARLAAAHQPTRDADQRIAALQNDVNAIATVHHRLTSKATGDTINVTSNWHWLDQGLQRARANPGLVIYKVQSAAYKFSWALIFLSTPLVALLFLWRRRFGLYDHATFVTYSISFMSLLAIVLELMVTAALPGVLIALLAIVAPPVHMFAQLRGAYTLSVFSALWRTVLLLLGSTWVLSAFVLGVIILEVSG